MVDISDAVLDGKAELFFPAYLIPSLRDLRGDSWRELVDRVSMLPDTHPDSLAFVLMMINLGDCMKCHSNYYKFLRGCAFCSLQTIRNIQRKRRRSATPLQQRPGGNRPPAERHGNPHARRRLRRAFPAPLVGNGSLLHLCINQRPVLRWFFSFRRLHRNLGQCHAATVTADSKTTSKTRNNDTLRPDKKVMRTHTDRPLRIGIIGGGVAGLAAAYELAGAGDVEINLFENGPVLGGLASRLQRTGQLGLAAGKILPSSLHQRR